MESISDSTIQIQYLEFREQWLRNTMHCTMYCSYVPLFFSAFGENSWRTGEKSLDDAFRTRSNSSPLPRLFF
ncbi:unnamed protein product [Onchocerca flexuosa]|uniref:Uncharacterized protein n=1 Tax=Onchocerca flexuosa TaxID=387005 RepID=A0A183H173_9BILA|nr:unnamed protein product [Onchocerca flexuosa]